MRDPVINKSKRLIPVACPSLTTAEAQAVYDCVISGRVSQGPLVARFEREFAEAHGKQFGVAVNSGTSALQIALASSDVGPGDEVIVPSMTMIACAAAILYLGATPVFIDSETEAGNADPSKLERLVTPRTKAIIVVALYGVPCDGFLDACLAHAPHAPVIYDCCEAHYASDSRGQPIASRGWLTCFSGYGNKIITGGEMGIVLTNSDRGADRMRRLRSHAFSDDVHFCHTEHAYGLRWTDLQASVALVQHARRAEFIARRSAIAARYIDGLHGAPVDFQARTFGSAWWVFPVLAESADHKARIRQALADEGIETRSWFVPLHRQGHLRRYATGEYPVAEDLAARGLYLPLFVDLADEDVDRICAIVRGVKP